MRVDIRKSNVESKYGEVLVVDAEDRVFQFVARNQAQTPPSVSAFSAESMHKARVQHGIDPAALQKAVLREGYVIDGLEINRYKPANSDLEGVVTEDNLHAGDLDVVRDWQVRNAGEGWLKWDGKSKCWDFWRPMSWDLTDEGREDEETWLWPEPFSEEERAAVQMKIQSGVLPWEVLGLDLHLWTVTEALGLDYVQAALGFARRDPKIRALRTLAKSLRFAQDVAPRPENDPPQDPVYTRLAEIAGVDYGRATVLASDPGWANTFVYLVQEDARKTALKKYGIDVAWPASKYHEHARALADLVVEKQRQYGDSARRSGRILAVLYPDGVPVEKYRDVLLVVRVLDKLSRIATHEVDAGGEEPWRDIAGYALLALEMKS